MSRGPQEVQQWREDAGHSPADSSAARRAEFLVAATLLLLCFFQLGRRDLTYFDEPRYAGVAREMSEAGVYAVPLLYGRPYTEKPPLYFWLAGLCGRAFGFRPLSYFLPNALAHLLAALLVYVAGRVLVSRRAGAIAALIFGACPLALHYARSAQLDSMLVFGETLAASGFLLACARRRFRYALLGAAGIALGSLVKGHVVLLALLAPLAWRLHSGGPRFIALARARPSRALLLLAVAVLPFLVWFAFVARSLGLQQALDLYVRKQVIDHAAGHVNHASPFPVGEEYLAALALMLPGLLWIPAAARTEKEVAARTFFTWGLAFFTVLALVPAKREIYMMPLAVPLALLAATRIDRCLDGRATMTGFERASLLGFVTLLAAGAAALPVFLHSQNALSTNAWLACVAGVGLGAFAFRAIRSRGRQAPLWVLLQIAVLSVFAEPAIADLSNGRFTEKAFGERVSAIVPRGEKLIVYGFSKAHALCYYARRPLVFADGEKDLEELLADGRAHFVVARERDSKPDIDPATFDAQRLAREAGRGKRMSLYRVRPRPGSGSAAPTSDDLPSGPTAAGSAR